MCSTTRREERGTFSKLNPPDLPPLHFYQRQSIKRAKIAPFSRNLFIQNPIPPKGTKFLDTRRAFPLVSPPRKNRKQSSIRPVSTCSLTERSLRGQTADSCGTGCWSRFSARTKSGKLARLYERLWCHRCARWPPLPRSPLPILLS